MKTFLLAVVASAAVTAQAGTLIPDRSTLNTLLGASAVTEGFENYTIGSGNADSIGTNLDSTTVVNGQGPGLVVPGVDFSSSSMQLDGAGYFGAPSNELLSNDTTLDITFGSPQDAFGVDLRDFNGYSLTGTVTIYATDDSTVLDTYSGISVTSTPAFFGYENTNGIGKVSLSSSGGWSPIIDNVEFGQASAAPEPATITMFLAGLGLAAFARKRRKA